MNIKIQGINLFSGYGMMKSTQDRMERQEKRDSQIAFFEKQKDNLKNMKANSLDEISRKLELLQGYNDQIETAKVEYNNSQMHHALDEARECVLFQWSEATIETVRCFFYYGDIMSIGTTGVGSDHRYTVTEPSNLKTNRRDGEIFSDYFKDGNAKHIGDVKSALSERGDEAKNVYFLGARNGVVEYNGVQFMCNYKTGSLELEEEETRDPEDAASIKESEESESNTVTDEGEQDATGQAEIVKDYAVTLRERTEQYEIYDVA